MSDETVNHGRNGHGVEFEHEDLSTRGIFAFMIGLAISGVVIYFIITGMYTFLDKYEKSQMTTASPLVKADESGRIASRAVTKADVEKAFKENGAPMLEDNEREQLHKFLMDQEKQLNSYGWVDEKAGVAHIPIERAMQLTVQRGLPVRPEGGANAPAGKTTAAPKALAISKQ
jgi:hypothetical protein